MTENEPRPTTRPLYSDIGTALGTDYFLLRSELTEPELDYLDRTRRFVHDEVLPVINGYWERAEVPLDLFRRLGELGLVGDGIDGYGCPPMTTTAAGLVNMELSRGDGSLGTFLGVQAGLAMRSIAMHGSEAQKQRWLPAMARCEQLGAFALTEPRHGSDSVALETEARRDGDSYVINGAKRWIGNGTLADVVVAVGTGYRRHAGQRVPRREGNTRLRRPGDRGQGLTASLVAGRHRPHRRACSGRQPPAGNPQLQGHRRGAQDNAGGLRLDGARPRRRRLRRRPRLHAQRTQFGKPLVSFQIVQEKLVRMLAEVTAMQLYCLRIGRLDEADTMSDTIASLAKLNNTTKAREVLAEARNLLGGNGILLEHHVIRHMADIEAIYTFEGTETIQTLIVGRDITGVSVFA